MLKYDPVVVHQCNKCGHVLRKKKKRCPKCKSESFKERLERRVITK